MPFGNFMGDTAGLPAMKGTIVSKYVQFVYSLPIDVMIYFDK